MLRCIANAEDMPPPLPSFFLTQGGGRGGVPPLATAIQDEVSFRGEVSLLGLILAWGRVSVATLGTLRHGSRSSIPLDLVSIMNVGAG